MRTALDTNIVSPVWSGAPTAGTIVAQLSKVRAEGALVVSAPVFVELSAVPGLNVQLVRKALAHGALHGQHELIADFLCGTPRRVVLLKDDLGYAVAVAQIDEDLVVIGPIGVDPAVDLKLRAELGLCRIHGISSSFPVVFRPSRSRCARCASASG